MLGMLRSGPGARSRHCAGNARGRAAAASL